MLKRVAVPLVALAFAAGCTATTPSSSAPVPSATSVSSEPASPMPTSAAPTSDAPASSSPAASARPSSAAPGPLPTKPAAWAKLVEDCPNEGQKPVIRGVVVADVTGDGRRDAVVSRSCEASTSYFPSTVEVFDSSRKRVGVLLKDVWDADNPWLTSLRVSDGDVIIKAHGSSGKQGNACADLNLTYRYSWTGSEFEQADRQVVQAGDCLPVG